MVALHAYFPISCQKTPKPGNSRLKNNLYLFPDPLRGKTFLIDTGVAVSVVPVSAAKAAIHKKSDDLLVAANGTPIPTYEHKTIPLQIGSSRFNWPFARAKVGQPIIGTDFLCQSGLLVDVRNKRLVKVDTGESITVSTLSIKPPPILLVQDGGNTRSGYKTSIWPCFGQR